MLGRFEAFAALLIAGNADQNLIAPSTISQLWARHLLDSAQLIGFARRDPRTWVDVGSGAGLPGIVVAMLTDAAVTLIEPRRLRIVFLERCIETLSLRNVSLIQAKAEKVCLPAPATVVSARAVAGIDVILSASAGFADRATVFVLPKGRSAQSEVATARRSWQGMFHVEQSIVDPDSGIVVATGVSRR